MTARRSLLALAARALVGISLLSLFACAEIEFAPDSTETGEFVTEAGEHEVFLDEAGIMSHELVDLEDKANIICKYCDCGGNQRIVCWHSHRPEVSCARACPEIDELLGRDRVSGGDDGSGGARRETSRR